MSYEEEARLEEQLLEETEEYKNIKYQRDECWSEEILETLKMTIEEMKGTLPIFDIKGCGLKAGEFDEGVCEVVDLLEKATKIFQRRRNYWSEVADNKLYDIRCLIPEGEVWDIEGESFEGILDLA